MPASIASDGSPIPSTTLQAEATRALDLCSVLSANTSTNTATASRPAVPGTSHNAALRPAPRAKLTDSDKLAIQIYASSHKPKPTHDRCIEWFDSQFGRKICRRTVSSILSQSDPASGYVGTPKRATHPHWPILEQRLFEWWDGLTHQEQATDPNRIRNKAKAVWPNIPEYRDQAMPVFSSQWTRSVQNRYKLRQSMLQGESASIPPPVFDKPLHNIDELASGPEALSKPETAAPDVISSENSPWAVTEEGLIGPSEWHFPSRSQPQASYQNYSTSDQIARHSVLASQLGPNWFFKGLPVASKADLQWISGKTGQPVTGNLFDIPEHRVPVFSALQPSISQNLCELPEHDFTQTVFAAFFGSSFALEFPVLDRFLFEKTAETAYGSTDGDLVSPGCISARACVLSALSFACYQKMMRYMSDTVQMELCAAEAHRLLLSITEHVSLDTLQTALLLGLQSAFRGHWKDAAFFHSIACRIVWALKGHMEPTITGESSRAEARDSHHIRVLFCLCNMLDKDIALRTGNSPLLVDVHCDVESLDNSIDRYNYLPSLSEFSTANKTRENTAPFLPGDPHLSHLKEKVCSKLLSASAMSDKDHQLLENVRELDDQIERWRLSIPPSLRPALSVSQLPPPNPAEQGIPHYVRCLSLQLDHDHLVTVIHTTVRRCTLESSDGIRDLHDVVHSSFDPSLEASRSTFWCLRSLINIIAEDTYRFITAYSTTAAIPLFLNILTHPLDIQAQQDLELLISAANLIRNMPSATLTLSESTGIQEIGSFLWRLVWLGSCAVNKAEGEKMSAQ